MKSHKQTCLYEVSSWFTSSLFYVYIEHTFYISQCRYVRRVAASGDKWRRVSATTANAMNMHGAGRRSTRAVLGRADFPTISDMRRAPRRWHEGVALKKITTILLSYSKQLYHCHHETETWRSVSTYAIMVTTRGKDRDEATGSITLKLYKYVWWEPVNGCASAAAPRRNPALYCDRKSFAFAITVMSLSILTLVWVLCQFWWSFSKS